MQASQTSHCRQTGNFGGNKSCSHRYLSATGALLAWVFFLREIRKRKSTSNPMFKIETLVLGGW